MSGSIFQDFKKMTRCMESFINLMATKAWTLILKFIKIQFGSQKYIQLSTLQIFGMAILLSCVCSDFLKTSLKSNSIAAMCFYQSTFFKLQIFKSVKLFFLLEELRSSLPFWAHLTGVHLTPLTFQAFKNHLLDPLPTLRDLGHSQMIW